MASGLGKRDTMLQNMLMTLGRKASLVSNDFRIAIADVPNKTELSRIGEIGVKSLELGVTGYLGTLEAAQRVSRIPEMAAFEKIFMTSDDVDDIFRRANTHGRLSLSRGRLSKDEIKDVWLTDVGRTVVEENFSEYKLILEDGSEISNLLLKVTKPVKIKAFANGTCPESTKSALNTFYDDIKQKQALSW